MTAKTFVKKAIKVILPHGIIVLREKRKDIKKHYGNDKKSFCPICKRHSYFIPFGIVPRSKAQCPNCGSLERHRALWMFLKKKIRFGKKDLSGKKFLHIAAESCFEGRFKKIFGENYITADLYNPQAKVKMDITDIKYPEKSFDIIICNHVLEHVNDDRKAMGEFFRVLKDDGFAILMVPIDTNRNETYEDFSITTEEGRLKAFGQGDHVRMYGRDYIERLRNAGFTVEETNPQDFLNKDEIQEMNCDIGGTVFYCGK